ncbi:MAG TPA: SEL1-like repeat protein [Verrucomicrobiota bacterium]|nr:hypothetical protein [Verrucomicrobiales bacterium]HRI13103.1 SEL1-like repeat protein [Verrucomicrobiota bacterium]
MKPILPLRLLLLGTLVAGLETTAQSVGRIRKSLDKATGSGAAGTAPAPSQPAAPVDPQAAAKAQAQAAANKALYDKRNKAAQAGADQRVVEFLKQRIEGGSADAAFDLGKRYEEGKGVAADPLEARRMYMLAAERGNEDAKKWLEEHPATKEEEKALAEKVLAEKGDKPKNEPKPAALPPQTK